MSEDYGGPERRRAPVLTEEQIELIAVKAADLAVQKVTKDVYAAVGQSIVEKVTWVIGVCAISLFIWLASKGIVKT
jgi:hypothetical protein